MTSQIFPQILSCAYCHAFPMYNIPNGKLACFHHRKMDGIIVDISGDDDDVVVEDHDTDFCLCLKCMKSYQKEEKESKKSKKRKTENITCILCDSSERAGGKCSNEHYLCVSCTRNYVEKTLMPQGTVFWDRIPCLSDECGEKYMESLSVQKVLSSRTKNSIERQQMDVSHLIVGERDPTSQKAIEKFTKQCPNCNVPVEKRGGCNHMNCIMCHFDWHWNCKCPYPSHVDGCNFTNVFD